MKKVRFLAFAAFAAALTMFASCDDEKAPSMLSEDAVAVQSTVCGFVQYSYDEYIKKEDKTETQNSVQSGAIVRVEYTIDATDKEGKPTTITLYKEVKSKSNGFYEANIVVPAGKTADVTVSTNFSTVTYKVNKLDVDDSDDVKCNFFGQSKATVAYGQTVVLNITAAQAGTTEDAYFGDKDNK